MSSLVEALATYTRLGMHIFPCAPNAKKPLHKGWQAEATTDLAKLGNMARGGANIGFACGHGFFGLDLDVKNGVSGIATLERWAEEAGADWPITWTSRTPTGGMHLIFRHPDEGFRNRSFRDVGVDWRSEGGFLVIPPSKTRAGAYVWLPGRAPGEVPLADVPEWLVFAMRELRAIESINRQELRATEGHKRPSDPTLRGSIEAVKKAKSGARNDTLNREAFQVGRLVRDGKADAEEAFAAFVHAGEEVGLPAAEVVATVESGLKAGEAKTPARKAVAQADELVRLALEAGEVWRTPGGVDGEGFASLTGDDGIRRNMPIRSRAFRHWLSGAYYRNFTKAPGSQPVADALVTLSGIALHDGCEYPAPVRVHGNSGEVWLDLGAPDWQVVHVTAAGWRIRPGAEGPRFVRPKGLQPLHAPVPGGDWAQLRQLLNIDGDGEHWPLIVAWLAGCMMPAGPYSVLILEGEQGSGKSTAARMLKGLVDSNSSPLRRPPRDERDLMIAATNGWVIAFDNVSGLPPYLCDALCTLATGGGFSTRQLYTDGDEQLFDAQRPVLINGIDAPSTRPDLLDRAVRVVLPAIPEDARRTEGELLGAFDAARPKLLGVLCDAASTAIRRRGEVQLNRLPRMADWASWVVACEPALDLAEGAFLNALTENRLASVNLALEASPIASFLTGWPNGEDWHGTSSSLLAWLNDVASEADKHRRDWPARPDTLSRALRRLAPELRRAGVVVTFYRDSHGERMLNIRRDAT